MSHPVREAQLVVIAKAPLPGRVKTRLAPTFGDDGAAALAAAALHDTLDAVAGVAATARTLVLDGAPDGVARREGVHVIPQRGGALDERLALAFDDVWSRRRLPMLLIGMDTPQVDTLLLEQCLDALLADGTDAVLGAARDGGWWALGLRRPDPGLILGLPMSTADTGRRQLVRLHDHGLQVAPLPVLTDVDTAPDAYAVAAVAPTGRFAARLARMAPAS